MKFHRPGRAGGQADAADQTFVVAEVDKSGILVQLESLGRADCHTCPAVSASRLVTDDILAEGLNPDAALVQIFEAVLAVTLFPPDFHDHQALVVGSDGGLQDVEIEVIFLDQAADDRLINHTPRKMKYDSF